MSTDYAQLYQFDPARIESGFTKTLTVAPTESFFPARSYGFAYGNADTTLPVNALEYTGWRDETLAWHLTCSLSANISPSPVTTIRGPEAIDFMRENFVNNIDKWEIGASKNGLMLLEDGTIAAQGVIIRSDKQEYQCFWLSPFIDYRFSLKDWDATCETTLDKVFVYQLQGPKSLQILEEATGDNLHDIAFCRSKMTQIDDVSVRILRFGMGNSLGYEVHGDSEFAQQVHRRLLEVGMPYGIRRMGEQAYSMNHTTGGSQQAGFHFDVSLFNDPGYVAFNEQMMGDAGFDFSSGLVFLGSFDGDDSERIVNPLEIGLSRCINWNHDFVGKEALLEAKEHVTRGLKTLVWNPDDIVDIFRSQFTDDPFEPIDAGGFLPAFNGEMPVCFDNVLDMEGNKIGYSGGRMMDWWNKAMISMAVMDIDFCKEGTQVQVVWGKPGSHQKLIRATVAGVPFNTHLENRSIDLTNV